MKGQLFISDILVSILILTIVVAFVTWQFDLIYSSAPDAEYEKLDSMAKDISQMAVKKIVVDKSPNWVLDNRWDYLRANMSSMIKPPYGYEATLSTLSIIGNGGCASKSNIAVSRRLVYYNKASAEFTVKVCV